MNNKGFEARCIRCKKKKTCQRAHLISYEMARIICSLQLGKPTSDRTHQVFHQDIRMIRSNKRPTINLCLDCHEYSDKIQEKMAKVLKTLQDSTGK